MNRIITLALAILIASPLFSQDEKKKKRKIQVQRGQAVNLDLIRAFSLPGIEFGENQKEKVAELKKEFGPKWKEVKQKLDAVLTDEQKEAREKVLQDARTASGQRIRIGLREKIEAALNLSDEQKKQYQDLQKEQREIMSKIREELMAMLTNEQEEEVRKRRAERNQKRKKKDSE